MDVLIWTGAAITLAGLGGLMWCIFRVARARKAGLEDDALRDVIKSTVTLNMAALFCSVIGLMMVIAGIFLG